MTTPRENLLKTFHHQEPDWVPIVALGDGFNRPIHMPPSFHREAEGLLTCRVLSRYFDIDTLDRIGEPWSETYRAVAYSHTTEGDIDTYRWDTPYGVITRRTKRVEYACPDGSPALVTWFPIEYPVKSLADYRAFAAIFEDMQYEMHPEMVDSRMAELGDAGICTCNAPPSPLGMCVRLFTGVEHLAFAWKEHPRELRGLLDAIADNYLRCCRGLAGTGIDGTINYDDTTTYAISPAMFRELEAPYLNQAAGILHGGGKLYIHHACGHVSRLLDEFRPLRIDGFDGPAAPPVGDTPVAAARSAWGDGITLMPFVEHYALESGDPAVIRRSIRSMFEQAGSPRAFVVDVVPPPAVPVENLWLAVDEAKRLSRACF